MVGGEEAEHPAVSPAATNVAATAICRVRNLPIYPLESRSPGYSDPAYLPPVVQSAEANAPLAVLLASCFPSSVMVQVTVPPS